MAITTRVVSSHHLKLSATRLITTPVENLENYFGKEFEGIR